ncbi:sulfonamide-resistant dihydropteroate synthase Sul1, partial (plasmid) [Acinetobacter baumannii]
MGLCRYGAHNCCLFARPIPIVEVTAAIEMLRVGSDVVDVGP